MDPASIVGLVEFGLSCASALSKVVSDIRGGAEDVRKLITEIEFIVHLNKDLDQIINENKRTNAFNTHGLGLVKISREECEQILARLRSLLVKAGVPAQTKPGEFYKIQATDIDRSIFRTANWARHKKSFDQITNDLLFAKIGVLLALYTYGIRVEQRAKENEQKVRAFHGQIRYWEDSGIKLEDLLPTPQGSAEPSIQSEPPVTTSHLGPEPRKQDIGMQQNPTIGDKRRNGNKATENNDTLSRLPSSSSTRSRSRSEVSGRPIIFKDLQNNFLWHCIARGLEQSLRHPTNGSDFKGRNQDGIPKILRDQDRPDGIALTRSFQLSKSESGTWTFQECQYPFNELFKRLNRKGVLQDALRIFERLPQPCKDLITQISEDKTQNSHYWAILLIDPISSKKKSQIARLLKREAARADISTVLAVLKRCKQVSDFDRELTTAVQEMGTFLCDEIHMKMENKLLDETRAQSWANELLRKQADERRVKFEQEKHRLRFEVQRIGMELDSARAQAHAKMEMDAREARERALADEAYETALAREKAAKERAIAQAGYASEELQHAKEEARRNFEREARAQEADEWEEEEGSLEDEYERRRTERERRREEQEREAEEIRDESSSSVSSMSHDYRHDHHFSFPESPDYRENQVALRDPRIHDFAERLRRQNEEYEEEQEMKRAAEEQRRKNDAERRREFEEETNTFRDEREELDSKTPKAQKKKAPITFKDAIDRKFTFPWRLCKSWKGMENLIRQAFALVNSQTLRERVQYGHYDLVGPDGEIILPQVWEDVIQPGWTITMRMWPTEEPISTPKLPPEDPGAPSPSPPSSDAPPPRKPMFFNAKQFKKDDQPTITIKLRDYRNYTSRIPTYIKVDTAHIEIATLNYFGLPWEYDRSDPRYIIILRELDHRETEELFQHSELLRRNAALGTEEQPLDSGEPEPMWVRRKKNESLRSQDSVEEFAHKAMKAYTGFEDFRLSMHHVPVHTIWVRRRGRVMKPQAEYS